MQAKKEAIQAHNPRCLDVVDSDSYSLADDNSLFPSKQEVLKKFEFFHGNFASPLRFGRLGRLPRCYAPHFLIS
ncbi:MAG: hypothetical protein KA972_03455 [Brachymonas sp.]|jgi:hypothetical protein|nr:hypothetical protein [Brachymonas sp.]